MVRHRIRLAAAALTLAVVAGLLLHGQAAPTPGRFIAFGASASATPSPVQPLASLLATPAPPSDTGVLGGLRQPLGSMLQGLNSETATAAGGEYDLLHELGEALRQRLDQLLGWVTTHHP